MYCAKFCLGENIIIYSTLQDTCFTTSVDFAKFPKAKVDACAQYKQSLVAWNDWRIFVQNVANLSSEFNLNHDADKNCPIFSKCFAKKEHWMKLTANAISPFPENNQYQPTFVFKNLYIENFNDSLDYVLFQWCCLIYNCSKFVSVKKWMCVFFGFLPFSLI